MTSDFFRGFIQNKPDASEDLRLDFPKLFDLMVGEFERDDPNIYSKKHEKTHPKKQDWISDEDEKVNPDVVSWELEQDREKNPTWGAFAQREEPYSFDPGDYIEYLIMVNGGYETENPIKKVHGFEMIEARDELILTAKRNTRYFCMYDPKQEFILFTYDQMERRSVLLPEGVDRFEFNNEISNARVFRELIITYNAAEAFKSEGNLTSLDSCLFTVQDVGGNVGLRGIEQYARHVMEAALLNSGKLTTDPAEVEEYVQKYNLKCFLD
ncbi:MAG: hypothetical protein V3V78_03425 [Candidatus Woesearchaeota archaeon]